MISGFFLGNLGVGTEDGVKGLESILGENNESTKMSSWGELKNIKSSDVADVNTWEVSSRLFDTLGSIGVYDQWTLSHDISRISIFSNTLSNLLGLSYLGEVISSTERFKGVENGLGIWESQVINNQW